MSWRFLFERAAQFRRQIALIALLALIGSLTTLAIPWLAGQLLGSIVEKRSDATGLTLLLLVGALLFSTALSIFTEIISARASLDVLTKLRCEAYRHIQLLPLGFHDRAKQGDLLALLSYEVSNLSGFLTATLARLPALIVTAAGAVVILFAIDWRAAAIVVVAMPLFYVALKLVGRRLRMLARRVRKAEAEIMSVAERDLEMLGAIKAFAVEDTHQRHFAGLAAQARALALAKDRLTVALGPITGLLAGLLAIAIVVLAGDRLNAGQSSASDLFATLFYIALLTRPLGELADVYGDFQLARGTLARLDAVLSRPIEPGHDRQSGHCSSVEPRAKGAIAFEKVSFGYSRRAQVLDRVDWRIAPGDIVALTGENGAGKSTLVKLLLRFYEVDEGTISLDSRDIRDWPVRHLRRQFGFVPQRPLLFNGSIARNIAFGDEHPSIERIERAARLAQASNFIEALPRGLETEIGDHGVRLSGGQGQRIALARALYRDPPILIFDEATSMFDLDGERAFIEQSAHALSNRTVIIITHRPASLRLASRIFEVRGGKVHELDAAEARGLKGL